jgi:hypothetical protein
MSAKTIVHRTDTWPIAVSVIYGKAHTEETLNEAYRVWTHYMQRGPHVLIVDMTHGNAGATPAQRAKVAAWIGQNEAELKARRQLAHVLVIDSAVVRGIVTAVTWLKPPANPQYPARNMDDAVDYALACLKEAGIAIDPRFAAVARLAGADKATARSHASEI